MVARKFTQFDHKALGALNVEIRSYASMYKCILDMLYLVYSSIILQSKKRKDISVQISTQVLNVTFIFIWFKFCFVKWKNHK